MDVTDGIRAASRVFLSDCGVKFSEDIESRRGVNMTSLGKFYIGKIWEILGLFVHPISLKDEKIKLVK